MVANAIGQTMHGVFERSV